MARTKEELKKLYQLDLPMAAVMRNPLDPVAIEKLFQFWKELDLIPPKIIKIYQVCMCNLGYCPNILLSTPDREKAKEKFIEEVTNRFIELNVGSLELFEDEDEEVGVKDRESKLKEMLISNNARDLLENPFNIDTSNSWWEEGFSIHFQEFEVKL